MKKLAALFQIGLCLLFLLFGVDLLVGSYSLPAKSGPYFILTFFASNLIILISLAVLAGVISRWFHKPAPREGNSVPPSNPPADHDDLS